MKKKTREELDNELNELHKKIVDYKKKEIESSVVEQNLKESEKKYRTLTENLCVGVFRSTVGPKGKFIEVNSAFVKMFGYRSKEEIYKFNVSYLYNNPEDRRKFDRILLEKGFLKNEVLNLKKKDGTSFVALVNTNAVKDEKGEVIYFDGVIKDITERKNVDEKIRESEEKLRNFMNTTTIGVWCFKPEFPIDITQPKEKQIYEFMKSVCIECNETYAIMMGTTKDKIIGITLSEVLPDSEETREYFRKFIKGGYKLDGGETHEISKTGEEKYFSNTFFATIIDNMLLQAWGTQTDITERKQAEETQKVLYNIAHAINTTKTLNELYKTVHIQLGKVIDTKNLYIALYDKENDTILFPYHIDEKSKLTSCPARKTLTAYVIRTGKPLLGTEQVIGQLIEAGEVGKGKKGTRCKIWLGVPLTVDNVVIGAIAVQSYTDASIYSEKDLEILEFVSDEIALAIEHKKTEQINLRLSESIRNARDGIILTNPESRITYVNPAFEKMSGYTQSELMNKDPADLIVTEDTAAIANEIRSAVKTKGEWKGELYCKRKNEDIYPIDTRVFAIKNEKGELVEIAAMQRDITKRKRAEEKIRESEKSFKDIFNNANDAIYIQDINGKFLDVNQGAVVMYGYTKEEMIGKTPDIIGAPGKNDLEMVGECIKKAYNGEPQQFEFWGQRKNGEVFPKIVRLSNGYYFGKKAIFAFAIDITEHKQAEEILNKELRKRKILQDVALILLETDLNKSIITALKAIRIGLDLPKAMLRIRVDPNNDWQIIDCRENLPGIESFLPTNKRGEEVILAYEKKEISVVNDIRKKYWYEKHKDIWEKTKTLAYLSIPCIDHSGDVKGILYLHDDKVRIWSDDDKNIGEAVAAELASIIDRKHAEEELKINRERLKTANSILRHDIANDIIVIKSALDIYRDENDETMLDEIEKRVEKSLNTIQKQRDQEDFIDSHAALDEYDMEKVAHDSIKNYPNIKINVKGTGGAYADSAIYSVFENIIGNAMKHSKTTKMDINISSDDEFCKIRFADYGIGIPDELKYKIFDEGFSYGKTGHTGIGLYIVQQTVDDYDGQVFVEDNKPNGAVFVIRLRKIIER